MRISKNTLTALRLLQRSSELLSPSSELGLPKNRLRSFFRMDTENVPNLIDDNPVEEEEEEDGNF